LFRVKLKGFFINFDDNGSGFNVNSGLFGKFEAQGGIDKRGQIKNNSFTGFRVNHFKFSKQLAKAKLQ
jgi:hypothetical protein